MVTKVTKVTKVTEVGKKAYHKLLIWRVGHKFVTEVYKATESFPKEERYGLTSQLRRAALSVPTNIVEGHAKRTKPDFLRYLDIAKASLAESEYLLEVALALEYLTNEKYRHLEEIRKENGYLLYKFISSVK